MDYLFQWLRKGQYLWLTLLEVTKCQTLMPCLMQREMASMLAPLFFHLSCLFALTLSINPYLNKPWFLHVCSTGLLKTLWEKEKLLFTSNFSSHSVVYPSRELSTIFINFKIVVCKLFQFGKSLLFGKGLNTFHHFDLASIFLWPPPPRKMGGGGGGKYCFAWTRTSISIY